MLFRFLFPSREPQFALDSEIRLRRLGHSDAALFCAHIHELHYEDFRDRFNGLVSDEWLDRYIERSLDNAIVVGAFAGDHLVAVAELHTGGNLPDGEAESAFSVASDWRRKGLGTTLVKALLKVATEHDISTIIVGTGPQNQAMKALARKFGARMRFTGDQSVGRINVAEGLRLAGRRSGIATLPLLAPPLSAAAGSAQPAI